MKWGRVCVQIRWGLWTAWTNPCCIPVVCEGLITIIISFNFWSVIRVVSGKINFKALLCREFNLFLRTRLRHNHCEVLRGHWRTVSWCRHQRRTLVSTEGRLVSKLSCTHDQYANPNEVYCLWLYLKDCVPTLDHFSPRKQWDWAVRAFLSGSEFHRLDIDWIADDMSVVTPVRYLI